MDFNVFVVNLSAPPLAMVTPHSRGVGGVRVVGGIVCATTAVESGTSFTNRDAGRVPGAATGARRSGMGDALALTPASSHAIILPGTVKWATTWYKSAVKNNRWPISFGEAHGLFDEL